MKNIIHDVECSFCTQSCINSLFEGNDIFEHCHAVRHINYKKGETILKQSSFANNIFFLRSGLLKLVLESHSNKKTIFQLALPNSFICLSFLFSNDSVPFTVTALKDSSVCVIKKEVLESLLQSSRKAVGLLIDCYNEESNYLLKKISALSTKSNHGKLADALLYTSAGEMKKENVTRFLTRNDWADLAAISLESVNKIMSELRNDLIIKTSRDGIEICNVDLLTRLSRIG